ncbi:hypothetical protein SEA_LITTLETOKYO_67 [Arthrobacter phage LittleTokyo]|nr:hypothetical protein SEA_LITTLETOKYO_67 [Arthrobacter phage LittleTokyo]
MRAWLCRRGWHGWSTWVGFHPTGRLAVQRFCTRAGCDVREWQ